MPCTMCVLKYMNNKHAYQYEENNVWQKNKKGMHDEIVLI